MRVKQLEFRLLARAGDGALSGNSSDRRKRIRQLRRRAADLKSVKDAFYQESLSTP